MNWTKILTFTMIATFILTLIIIGFIPGVGPLLTSTIAFSFLAASHIAIQAVVFALFTSFAVGLLESLVLGGILFVDWISEMRAVPDVKTETPIFQKVEGNIQSSGLEAIPEATKSEENEETSEDSDFRVGKGIQIT